MSITLRLVSKILKKIFIESSKLKDNVRPFVRTQVYQDYILYYSKGTLLMKMIDNKTLLYEPIICKLLKGYIKDKESPSFIDIGSNIGLISLYMVKHVPNIKIYAFDPGAHQSKLFQRTIKKNKLGNQIELFEIALSNKDEETDFYIHTTEYAPGDGFIDTGRYGKTSKIIVKSNRLDTWWIKQLKPHIDIIKIDTEGAELWVLEGAVELINECRPVIVTEMSKLNYKKYPYSAKDVYNKMETYRYKVYNETMQLVTAENLDYLQNSAIENYVCIPY